MAALYYLSCEGEEETLTLASAQIKQQLGDAVVYIGQNAALCTAETLSHHFISLFRGNHLQRNERELILSAEEQQIVMQLCLAEENRKETGEFDASVSHVLEVNEALIQHRLDDGDVDYLTSDLQAAHIAYSEWLKENNLIDLSGIFQRIQKEMQQNEDLQQALSNTSVVLVSCKPTGPVEVSMLNLLAKDKETKKIVIESPLTSTPTSDSVTVRIVDSSLSELKSAPSFLPRNCIESPHPAATPKLRATPAGASTPLMTLTPRTTPNPHAQPSATELYVEGVLLSYLHLLVNSRSEVALSRVLNVPDRELNHKAFTSLKRVAKSRRMPMYQTAVSILMRIRLGGKRYAPDPNCPVREHVKGLGEFVDLINKLQTIIEEDPKPVSAIRRVLSILKNTIVCSRGNVLRRSSVESVTERMKVMAAVLVERQEGVDSPAKEVSDGGSMCGRDALRVIRQILDHASGKPVTHHAVNYLSDICSSQATPMRLPCVLSTFRSPIECSPESKLNRPLADRVRENVHGKREEKTHIMRYKSCMDWAKPIYHVGMTKIDEEDDIIMNMPPSSKITVQPKGTAMALKPVISIKDKENVTENNSCTSGLNHINSSPKTSKVKTATNKPAKRTVKDLNKPNAKRKKTVPLGKGQKQLTAFFRM